MFSSYSYLTRKEWIYMLSPTWGRLTFTEMLEKIEEYLSECDDFQYRFIIGTDSQIFNGSKAVFVTALIVHRVGKGAVYFYEKELYPRKFALEERMFTEVSRSLTLASRLAEEVSGRTDVSALSSAEIEIHVDVGANGKTRDLVNSVVGMVRGSGFPCRTKPFACGASSVADRYTRSSSATAV